jgi:hypothetical protein
MVRMKYFKENFRLFRNAHVSSTTMVHYFNQPIIININLIHGWKLSFILQG